VVFDLASASRNMAALLLAEGAPARRLLAVKGAYFVPDQEGFLRLAARGAALYTDRDYPGPYGADFAPPPPAFGLARWGAEDLAREGAMTWSGVYRYTGDLTRPEAVLAVFPPAALAGRDVSLVVRVRQAAGAGDPRCRRVLAAVAGSGGAPLELDVGDIRIPVPAGAFSGGAASAALLFPGFAERGPGDPAAVAAPGGPPAPLFGTDPAKLLCDYVMERAEILPADAGDGAGAQGAVGPGEQEGPARSP
jgi:hypothetical protein